MHFPGSIIAVENEENMKRIQIASIPTSDLLSQTIAVLKSGGLILFPTETTYGAGVDATQPKAVNKLLAYKSRREGKPLSIAVANQEMAEQYVILNEQARTLYRQFLPGPLTVISQAIPEAVAPGVASEFGSLGVRIPAYPLILNLISVYGKPLTATSANASGKARPYTIDGCLADLSAKQRSQIDLILDAGELPPNPPSTIIDTTLSTPVTFRTGQLQLSEDQSASTELTSKSAVETQGIAGKFLLKHWNAIRSYGLLVGLDGSLGVGKTVFTKGIAQFLGITDRMTSPTYSYIESYDYSRHGVNGTLHHLDLWKVGSVAELDRLEISRLLQPNDVVVIEWFGSFSKELALLAKQKSTPLVHVAITDRDLEISHRRLIVTEIPSS